MAEAGALRAAVPVSRPVAEKPDPSLLHLLRPKWLSARSRGESNRRGARGRLIVLLIVGGVFWFAIFRVLVKLLTYFRGVPEIGVLLAGKLLGLLFAAFLSILLLSNIISALSTFFLARDLDMLVSSPVDWLKLYLAKLGETLLHSSWMVTLMAVPIFAAFGWVYESGWAYGLAAIAAYVPFLIIPAVLGSLFTLVLVNVFPARRTRDILSVIAVMAAAALALLFRMVRPEKLARPEGFRELVDFIAVLRAPSSPVLPSEWLQKGIMSSATGSPDLLSFYLLWSTAAACIVVGALAHSWMYAIGFTKAQEGAQSATRVGAGLRVMHRLLSPFGVLRRELVIKELRIFFRDSTQWSQLILLGVLVVVYVFNVKYLPLGQEGLTSWLRHLIPFLNIALAGFVIAAIAGRFIFPTVSLEGRTLWLLKSSPMPVKALLWAKFWTGTAPLLVLALGIVVGTNVMIGVSEFMMWTSIFSITLITFAVAGLAIGMGTLFPQYQTENAAQIPTSFGGLLFMTLSVALIGGVVMLEARPVMEYIRAESGFFGTVTDPRDVVIGFGSAALLCLAATLIPIRIAMRQLEKTEL